MLLLLQDEKTHRTWWWRASSRGVGWSCVTAATVGTCGTLLVQRRLTVSRIHIRAR
jgi:hypothetical protein